MLHIFVVSDATGETAERMMRSALVQFKNAEVTLTRRGHIRTPAQVRAVVSEAIQQESLIVHTLVSNDLRRLILAECRAHHVDSMDLMGPVLDRLSMLLKISPRQKPGLVSQLTEAKSRQIEAVEFAFRHDDGEHADELNKAEVILVGVSRTMKTPVTLYLAYRGWFAANVPIVPEVTQAEELLALPRERVFCLVTTPDRLLELRQARANSWSIPEGHYGSLQHIQQELLYSKKLSRDMNWQQIEVAGKSVEEVAHEIILLLSDTKGGSGPAW